MGSDRSTLCMWQLMVNEKFLFYKDGKMNDQSFTSGKIISGNKVKNGQKRNELQKGETNEVKP